MLYLHKPDLIDPKGFKLEGKGKHARHAKFKTPADVDQDRIEDILNQSLSFS